MASALLPAPRTLPTPSLSPPRSFGTSTRSTPASSPLRTSSTRAWWRSRTSTAAVRWTTSTLSSASAWCPSPATAPRAACPTATRWRATSTCSTCRAWARAWASGSGTTATATLSSGHRLSLPSRTLRSSTPSPTSLASTSSALSTSLAPTTSSSSSATLVPLSWLALVTPARPAGASTFLSTLVQGTSPILAPTALSTPTCATRSLSPSSTALASRASATCRLACTLATSSADCPATSSA
mmetsp:Transcript_18530/g.71539  ORF Transcript_18530/g.71539 Transcript_18530/m.71539 type:complete len:241 (-) Transcript_18530:878-1600(-)